jgi:hypothetical protein
VTAGPLQVLQRARATVIEPRIEALHRPGARRRWSLVAAVVIVLCAAPALVAAFPVSTPHRSIPQLLGLVRSSESLPFTGFVESRGTLDLPEVNTLGNQVANLLSNRSQLRVWHASANQFRIDDITTGGEEDTYVRGRFTLTWNSGQRRLLRQQGASQLPLPEPPDVLPSQLAQHLVAAIPADGSGVRSGGNRRIAGRSATGLIWHPNDRRSLVGEVRMWIDPTNGLPLRVQLSPVGSSLVGFETSFLDLSFTPPSPALLRFDVRGTKHIDVQDTPPPAPQDLAPQFRLPTTLAGLPRRSDAHPFIATYGSGAALVAVTAVDNSTADSIAQQIDSPGHPSIRGAFGEGTLVQAPMLRALIFSSADRGYALAGTVTTEVLSQMALELVTNPPQRAAP